MISTRATVHRENSLMHCGDIKLSLVKAVVSKFIFRERRTALQCYLEEDDVVLSRSWCKHRAQMRREQSTYGCSVFARVFKTRQHHQQ